MPGIGPLPKDPSHRRRRNEPTFPTTRLPLSGFAGAEPVVPRCVKLGRAGRSWWAWAWRTPQAAAWNLGDVWALARRAQLEDVWADQVKAGEATAAMANAIAKLEHDFGLDPKGMAELRWEIVADSLVSVRAAAVS